MGLRWCRGIIFGNNQKEHVITLIEEIMKKMDEEVIQEIRKNLSVPQVEQIW